MNTPKLPPLLDLLEKAISHFAQAVHYSDTNGRIGAANNLRKEIKAYALASIEAQGVPDGWQLVPKEPTDAMVRAALHLDLSYMPGHEGPDRAAVYKTMLASAPPAPQAHRVQQEPVDFIVSVVVIKSTGTGFNTQNKLYPVAAVSREEAHGKALNLAGADFPEHHLHTICSYPAQQAKPQPLTQSRIYDLFEQYKRTRVDGLDVSKAIFTLGVRAAEAAHGITKEKEHEHPSS